MPAGTIGHLVADVMRGPSWTPLSTIRIPHTLKKLLRFESFFFFPEKRCGIVLIEVILSWHFSTIVAVVPKFEAKRAVNRKEGFPKPVFI
jgi:hypothetical protein